MLTDAVIIELKIENNTHYFQFNFILVRTMSHVISMKVMEKDKAQKQFDEARAQNKTAGQVKQVSKAPARGTDVFSISVNLAPRAAAYFTLTYQ